MGISESLKDSYYKAEDAWYRLVDKISDKLPAFGSGIDKIEEKGVPTFPVAIAIILILSLLILFLAFANTTPFVIKVIDSEGNALVGAGVTVYLNGDEVDSRETSADGKAVFYLANNIYSVKIENDGYKTVTRDVSSGEEEFVLSDEETSLTKAVALKTSNGQLINGTGTITYSCVGESSQRFANYENGRFTADFSDCTELQIDSITGYTIIEGRASFSGDDSVTVDKLEQNTGTVTVSLSSSVEVPAGIKVNLYTEEGVLTKSSTNNSGVVIFNDVPTASYYVATIDPSGNFQDYDGSTLGEIKEISKDETESFNVVLTKSSASQITITVKDAATGLPLSGAQVKRTSATNQNDLDTKITGNSGQVIFNVPIDSEYLVSVEHPDYIISDAQKVSSNGVAVFDLIEATESNSQSLLVKIIDPQGDPISSTRVVLKRTDDTKVDEKITGADGTVEFYNLDLGSYFVFANKPSFYSTTSPSVQVLPRRINTLDVTLDIGTGIIRLEVSDESGVLPGASVTAIETNGTTVSESSTNSEGIADFSIRVDKEVFFKIETPGKATYYTASMYADADSLLTKPVLMKNNLTGLSVDLLGLYASGAEVEGEVISAGNYTAKLLLNVPKGSFNEAGVHIRTGKANEGTTNLMEEDSVAIGNISASTTKFTRGTTYTPLNGYNIDSKNFVSGTSKWANIIWNNPSNAVYEVEAEIVINDSLSINTENFWYRAWSKGSGNLKDPQSTVAGNELYSNAKNRLITLNNTKGANLCSGSFCKIYSVETLTGKNAGRTSGITNKITATQGNTYKLIAELVNIKAISGAVLEVEGRGITVDEILVNGASFDDETIILGGLTTDTYNKVEIEFTTNTPGSGTINLKVNSANKTELDSTVSIEIKANKKFVLDIIPKQLIPYADNTFFFTVTDNNSKLPGVIIEIIQDDSTLGIVETDGEGLALFEISDPTPGDVITIIAKKEGYDTIEINKEVDERILLITPPEINETIKIGEITSIDQTILITNQTVEELKVKRIDIDGELSTYLNIEFDNFDEAVIESGEDQNYNLTIKTNSKAQRLREPLTIEGTINIDVEAEGVNQTFTTELPVRIRLSMPGFLDSDRCLKVSPSTIEFSTSTSEATQSVEVENNCVAEGVKVNLFELEAKLNEASKLGTILVSGDGFLNASLGESYNKIAEIFESDAKQTLNVRFVPNASAISGTQNMKVTLRGKNVADEDTEETVETSFTIDATMSNLAKCLEVETPENGLILEVAGWNLGYDRIVTSNLSSYANNYQGFQGRGRQSSPYGLNQVLPFTGNNSGPQQYEQDKFVIKNSCAVDIEVDLDPDSRVNVGEETFTIGPDSDATISVSPGYTLGKYSIGVNAKVANTDDKKRKVDTVSVTVRKLGELDASCIKVNVSTLNFNSFLYQSEKHKVFNYCYNSGVALDRSNSAVTVQCEAPNALTTGIPYFQTGAQFGGLYGQQYPLGGAINSYSQYLQPTGAPSNSCPMVGGTRVYDRRLNGDVEELTFEVLPSAQYLPQRKLFNSQNQTYGIFNSLVDIRQWATETDARTNIYGNLSVQYTNQYGSMQSLSFPIEIEDIWRLGESIDSAINWGDPNATPQSCVSDDQKNKSLDIQSYWSKRGNSKAGAVPDSEFNKNANYTYIAEPPAVRIGAPSQTNIYPNPYNRTTPSVAGAGNCGLLDSISNIKYEKNWGGVEINIESLKKGSILANTLGPNLAVSINRSGIQYSCVYINTTVTADLTRAINLQKGQVQWNLKAVVTKPGYVLQTNDPSRECYTIANANLDCKSLIKTELNKTANKNKDDAEILALVVAQYPSCGLEITENDVKAIRDEKGDSTSTCNVDASEYGFDYIDKVTLKGIENNLADYCESKFCSSEMFSTYLYDKYQKIKEVANGKTWKSTTTGKLSELYKEAGNVKIGDKNYFTIANSNKPISKIQGFSDDDIKGYETVKDITTQYDNPKPINDMIAILNKVKAQKTETFLEVQSNLGYNDEIIKVGELIDDKYYVNLDNYILINEKIAKDYTTLGSGVITITELKNISISSDLMKYLSENSKLVDLININTTNKEEINRVYEANPELNAIRNYADGNVFITNISEIKLPNEFASGKYSNVGKYITKLTGNDGVGKYAMQIDLNYKELSIKNDLAVDVNLSDRNELKRSPQNILLAKDFKLTAVKESTNAIADEKGYYNNIPVKLTAGVHAQQEYLEYGFDGTGAKLNENLINWSYNGSLIADSGVGGTFIVEIPLSSSAKTLTGRYFHPLDESLVFEQVRVGEATINAQGQILTDKSVSTRLSTGNGGSIQFTNINGITNVAKIVELVKADNACAVDNAIIWNEEKLN